ncbi:MAG TPA: hypothetical protein DCR40_21965 [Prolixibacteraceae bacterium]|nr:hypothetical protein [Prolixibacteraceae bacterium]
MTQKNLALLKITLIIFAIVALVYGVTYLFVPQIHVEASGSAPVPSGWIRWFGPILVALGIGTIMVLRNPNKQGPFVKTLAIGTLLCGLTLIYSTFFESEGIGNMEQSLIPGIVLIVLSIMFWISLQQSKELL